MFLSWSCCDKHFRLNVPSHLKLNWTVSMTGSSDQGDNIQSVQTFYVFKGMHEVDVIYSLFLNAFRNTEGCRGIT